MVIDESYNDDLLDVDASRMPRMKIRTLLISQLRRWFLEAPEALPGITVCRSSRAIRTPFRLSSGGEDSRRWRKLTTGQSKNKPRNCRGW